MTLVEVVCATMLLATLLASAVYAHANLTRRAAHHDRRVRAIELVDVYANYWAHDINLKSADGSIEQDDIVLRFTRGRPRVVESDVPLPRELIELRIAALDRRDAGRVLHEVRLLRWEVSP